MGQIGYLECVQVGYRQRINPVPLETGKDELLRLLRQMNPAYTVLDRKLPGRDCRKEELVTAISKTISRLLAKLLWNRKPPEPDVAI